MRINKMIKKNKIFDLLPNSLNQFFKEMYGDQFGEFVCGYWDFEGNILKEMCTNETLTLMCTTIFPSVCSWDLIGDND